MDQGKHGLQVFDEMGAPLLEVGPHVIGESSEFAQKIGLIAASWSQAEVNLNCLFAVLLDTTPEEAARTLKKHSSAASATAGARKIAAETLSEDDFKSLNEIMDRLDRARSQRNRIQHDVWSRKAGESWRVFAIHANDYLSLVTKLMATAQLKNGKAADLAIEVATGFAATVSNSYTTRDLENIATEISSISQSLMHAMLHRTRLRLTENQ